MRKLFVLGMHGPLIYAVTGNNATFGNFHEVEVDFMEKKAFQMADALVSPSNYLYRFLLQVSHTLLPPLPPLPSPPLPPSLPPSLPFSFSFSFSFSFCSSLSLSIHPSPPHDRTNILPTGEPLANEQARLSAHVRAAQPPLAQTRTRDGRHAPRKTEHRRDCVLRPRAHVQRGGHLLRCFGRHVRTRRRARRQGKIDPSLSPSLSPSPLPFPTPFLSLSLSPSLSPFPLPFLYSD